MSSSTPENGVDPEAGPHHEEVAPQGVERDAGAETEDAQVPRDIRADEERQADRVQDQDEGKGPQRWGVTKNGTERHGLEPHKQRIHQMLDAHIVAEPLPGVD